MRGCSWACICSAAALALALAGCGTVVPHPTPDDGTWAAQQWPGSNVATLAQGRDLYVCKCGGCHSLYAPTALPTARWPGTVDEMVHNAGLHGSERDLIVHYLMTASRGHGGTVANAGGSTPRP